MQLRYGVNPGQRARASLDEPGSPLRVVSGHPSYINVLDALNAWQLVAEASTLGSAAATSFKHVSPAGAALAGELDPVIESTWGVDGAGVSPVARAYLRARDADPRSAFGDFVAVSEPVDASLARILASVVSDGIVAPGYEAGTVAVLSAKKGGRYLVLEADPSRVLPVREVREAFGVRLEQETTRPPITRELVRAGAGASLPPGVVDDVALAMVTARWTQSNSVVFAKEGMVLGVGAGQQSRVDCTRLAGAKVDAWWLRRHPRVRSVDFRASVRRQDRINLLLGYIDTNPTPQERASFAEAVETVPEPIRLDERASWLGRLADVVMASDGYIPFRDNIDHAARHGIGYLAHPAGSSREGEVQAAAREHGITLLDTGLRLFHH
ncbi:MAG TPA: phosphoribosylaminoimidazolecarboxamide formyltransferase [Acidimicrobiales bacterium]|nr:phosphoribosylaminoimidazolecarboxamide formyltransferase [Acidimicrobiales bacterium]